MGEGPGPITEPRHSPFTAVRESWPTFGSPFDPEVGIEDLGLNGDKRDGIKRVASELLPLTSSGSLLTSIGPMTKGPRSIDRNLKFCALRSLPFFFLFLSPKNSNRRLEKLKGERTGRGGRTEGRKELITWFGGLDNLRKARRRRSIINS